MHNNLITVNILGVTYASLNDTNYDVNKIRPHQFLGRRDMARSNQLARISNQFLKMKQWNTSWITYYLTWLPFESKYQRRPTVGSILIDDTVAASPAETHALNTTYTGNEFLNTKRRILNQEIRPCIKKAIAPVTTTKANTFGTAHTRYCNTPWWRSTNPRRDTGNEPESSFRGDGAVYSQNMSPCQNKYCISSAERTVKYLSISCKMKIGSTQTASEL